LDAKCSESDAEFAENSLDTPTTFSVRMGERFGWRGVLMME
jgi:hypothetical protein